MTKVAKIVGTPNESFWAQTLTLDGFYLVLSLESLEGEDVSSLGKELIVFIEDAFQSKKRKDLIGLKEMFQEMLKKPYKAKVSFVAAELIGDILYLALLGKGTVFLKRGGLLGTVLSESEGEITTSSGRAEEGDVVILATEQLQNLVPKDSLFKLLEEGSFEEAAENIAPVIHGRDDAGGAAAILFKIETQKQEERRGFALPTWTFLENRRRKFLLFLTGFLLVLFVGSILFALIQQSRASKEAQFQKILSEAEKRYEEGISLLDLNRELAREPLFKAKSLLEEAKIESASNVKKKESLSANIEEALKKALKKYTVENPAVFFDLKIIKEDIEPFSLSLSEKYIAILDTKQSALYTISLANKSYTALGGGFAKPQKIGLMETAAYVLDEKGILKIDRASKKQTLVLKRDENFGEIVSLVAFLQNFYLLDKKNPQIVKFVPVEEDKFSRKNYFQEGVKLDFSAASSMAIDGAIYVLFEDGTIRKYLEGRIDNFALSGIDAPFKDPTVIFTNKDQDFVYVLDKGNKRIVVLKKNGSYEAQYIWEGIKDVSDFVVSESEKKMLLLSGNKIYAIELK